MHRDAARHALPRAHHALVDGEFSQQALHRAQATNVGKQRFNGRFAHGVAAAPAQPVEAAIDQPVTHPAHAAAVVEAQEAAYREIQAGLGYRRTPAEYGAFQRAEIAKWAEIARAVDARAE